ncbi:hypothetical protein D3C75_1019480 [compost metagenome]
MKEKITSSRPPTIICRAVDSNGEEGSLAVRENREPADQDMEAAIRAAIPIKSNPLVSVPPPDCQTSRKIPARPRTTPRITPGLGFLRLPSQLNTIIHKGTAATKSDAMDEGTLCSAQATIPLPPSSNKAPTIPAFRHSVRLGLVRSLVRATT